MSLPPFSQPLWDGSPLAGRTILLHAEQGIGDSLQFIRFASLVKQHGGSSAFFSRARGSNEGGRVVVGCSENLPPLLASCAGVDQAVSSTAFLHFDVHAPLMSLPRILGITLATLPAPVPYLVADAALVERWRRN